VGIHDEIPGELNELLTGPAGALPSLERAEEELRLDCPQLQKGLVAVVLARPRDVSSEASE
jgi:hypothetical protein